MVWQKTMADMEIESFRLMFTVNGDSINHHVTPSADNVHGEILTLCTYAWNHIPP